MAYRDLLTRPSRSPDSVIRYGEHPDQIIDLRSGGSEPDAPVVVLLHGGFWRDRVDRMHTRPMADALAAAGYTVCSVEYRRTGGEGGGYPGTFDDVATAVDAILAAPPTGGGVVLVGHSAGGQLALWSALRQRLPVTSPWHETLKIDGVVALAAVSDLGGSIETGLGKGAVSDLLGGRLELLGETDPLRLLPYGHDRLVLLHGTEDDVVPIALSRRFAEREKSAVLVELEGVEHFGLIDPLSDAWPYVLEAIRSIVGDPSKSPA
ncbi:alpha/beta hydrolase [Planotetraspora sp. A-T 1434]|uniref:alpha/beta hydrolase n=1 Tax=Planotetraspora sp. A-T 1434 TaxID=2979219 RepID=UPI0021C23272|nr:alpha/beta hydrolase [Planotetraspora sp. A-T 1434]MCT9931437.1 alpha/beta hydrolase [Planotetraspora sp. A-T 1434]